MLCCFHGGKKSSVDFRGLGSFRFTALKCTFLSAASFRLHRSRKFKYNFMSELGSQAYKWNGSSLQLHRASTEPSLSWVHPWSEPGAGRGAEGCSGWPEPFGLGHRGHLALPPLSSPLQNLVWVLAHRGVDCKSGSLSYCSWRSQYFL